MKRAAFPILLLIPLVGCVGLTPRSEAPPPLAYDVVATAKLYARKNPEKPKPKPKDCSDFTQRVFRAHGIRIPRTSRAQSRMGRLVRQRNLHAGDLVFFSRRSWSGSVDHVGLYAGDRKFLHVSDKRHGVVWASLDEDYFRKHYLTARRIIN